MIEKASVLDYFSEVKDPRVDRRKQHKLIDIFVIAICGVICGADDWVAIELFGKSKYSWLKTFLELPNGIPSHDTFGGVFSSILPLEFVKTMLLKILCFFDILLLIF